MSDFNFKSLYLDQIHSIVHHVVALGYEILFSVSAVKGIMQPLFPLHRDRQLVFLTEEERASLAQADPGSSEPSDSSLLDRLFSSDISSVYRLGKRTTGQIRR